MTDTTNPPDAWLSPRRKMVEQQLKPRGIHDEHILRAMLTVPRERFVPEPNRHEAYEDRALAIGLGQTISQPFIVAFMTQALQPRPSDHVLEIGTGTGYQTAILAMLCRHVTSVERITTLRDRAAELLASLRTRNVTTIVGDGSVGAPDHAPFDRIIVTAAAPSIPASLTEQLTDNGVMILPVGAASEQTLVRVTRTGDGICEQPLIGCRFVKLIGRQGWTAETR